MNKVLSRCIEYSIKEKEIEFYKKLSEVPGYIVKGVLITLDTYMKKYSKGILTSEEIKNKTLYLLFKSFNLTMPELIIEFLIQHKYYTLIWILFGIIIVDENK